MANNINKIAKSLKKSIKTEKGTKAYDTAATVTRIEGKTAWVHIPGGVDETPVKLTMNAKKGETVQVRVSGGKAWLTGNASAPPTDDTTANKAQTTATEAKYAADNATAEAVRAKDAADRAETSATNAHTAATNAQESADSALVSLATVEDVVGVLNWITAHGTMTANGSAALDPTKVYFVRDNNGDYTVGSYNYSIVSEPKAEDRTSYYTLSVDESVQNYVATHVTVNSEGMWLIPDQNGTPTSNGKKILIATGAGSTYTTAGTYIIDRTSGTDKVVASFKSSGSTIYENGNIAAEFGATTRIGRNRSYGCLEVNSCSVSAYESNEEKYRLDYDFDMAGAFLRATDDLTLYSSFPTNPTVYIGTSTRNNDLVVRGNVNIASGANYKINGTNLSASDVGAVPTSDISTNGANNTIPKISGNVLNINQYIDFKANSSTAPDYDLRLSTDATTTGTSGTGFLHINGQPMKDFVVGGGTSSSWYYRKWKSGKIEAWTTYNAGSQTPSQWVTGWYYKDINVAIPSGIFSATPTHVVATNIGSDYQYSVFTACPTSSTSIKVRVVKPNSGAATPVLSIYASNMI